jgi:hypothetical protein
VEEAATDLKLHGKLEEAATDLKIIEKNIVATTNKI